VRFNRGEEPKRRRQITDLPHTQFFASGEA